MIVRGDLVFPGAGDIIHLHRIVDDLDQINRDLVEKSCEIGCEAFVSAVASIDWRPIKPDLVHPLSEKWLSLQVQPRQTRQQENEFSIFSKSRIPVVASIERDNSAVFISAIENCYKNATGALNEGIRARPVFLVQGRDGETVTFCESERVVERLCYLHKALRTSSLSPCILSVVALSVFLNIHPLCDGNGRTGRALFNSVLNRGIGLNEDGQIYIPLKRIIDYSQGGFEIRLRDAEINANWKPLFSYFHTALAHLINELNNK